MGLVHFVTSVALCTFGVYEEVIYQHKHDAPSAWLRSRTGLFSSYTEI